MAIYKGTTPTFIFTFDDEDVNFNAAHHIYFTISYGNKKITKTGNDIQYTEKEISVFFSQQETLDFDNSVKMQINWTYGNGLRASTPVMSYSFSDNLLDKVVD